MLFTMNPSQPNPQIQTQKLQTLLCKKCKSQVFESFYFCPICGNKIKEPPFKFSWGKTIALMLESVFLPPFGIIPGVKYLTKDSKQVKIIGAVAILLTILSTTIITVFTINLINKTLEGYSDIYQTQEAVSSLYQ